MTDLHTRISVRAYFLAEAAGWPERQHEAHWLAAERVEHSHNAADAAQALIEAESAEGRARFAKRRAAALKGAATRKANKAAAEGVVAASALKTAGRPIRHVAH